MLLLHGIIAIEELAQQFLPRLLNSKEIDSSVECHKEAHILLRQQDQSTGETTHIASLGEKALSVGHELGKATVGVGPQLWMVPETSPMQILEGLLL